MARPLPFTCCSHHGAPCWGSLWCRAAEGPWGAGGQPCAPASLGVCMCMNRVLLRLLGAVSEFLCFTLSSLKVEQRGLVGKELLGLSLPCRLIVRKGDLHPGIWGLRKHYHQGKGRFLPEISQTDQGIGWAGGKRQPGSVQGP